MPFYEYQCKSCGHDVEAMQKVSDAPLKKCPQCGKSQLQRLMSAPVFRLKGGGWYETDFKDDKDKKRNLAEQPDAQATKDTDSKGADAKTDTKSEVKASDSATSEGAKPKESFSESTNEKSVALNVNKARGKRAKGSSRKRSTKISASKAKRR